MGKKIEPRNNKMENLKQKLIDLEEFKLPDIKGTSGLLSFIVVCFFCFIIPDDQIHIMEYSFLFSTSRKRTFGLNSGTLFLQS